MKEATIATQQRELTEEDAPLLDWGWVPVGMSLWSHPNAPHQTYFTFDQASKIKSKYGQGKSHQDLQVRLLKNRIRELEDELVNVVYSPWKFALSKRWQYKLLSFVRK